MKNFSHWGVKTRNIKESNYTAIWNNLITFRFGECNELPADKSEFYDVALGTYCNLNCKFCYTNASSSGRQFSNVSEKAKMFFGNMPDNDKPFQIAIGSSGEPTTHPEFNEFVKTIHDLGIVPNYTTNGVILGDPNIYPKELLQVTEQYCGGVAISTNNFNEEISRRWRLAVDRLLDIDVHINLHCIISDKKSVDEFEKIYKEYSGKIKYFVILPLMNLGRSNESLSEEAFEYLIDKGLIQEDIAFGAMFYPSLVKHNVKCWLYPPESMSKNLILDDEIKITPSSFDKQTILKSYTYENN